VRLLPAALGLLIASGCSFAYRFGAGPTVDGEGHVGLHAYAGGAIGFGDEDDGWSLEETAEVGVGTEVVPGTLVLVPEAGLDFTLRGEETGGRIGLRNGGHFAFGDGDVRARMRPGVAGAYFLHLDDDGEWTRSLGAELRVYALLGDPGDATVLVYSGIVYEARGIDDLDDMFERH
jgi:hypothetical protein